MKILLILRENYDNEVKFYLQVGQFNKWIWYDFNYKIIGLD